MTAVEVSWTPAHDTTMERGDSVTPNRQLRNRSQSLTTKIAERNQYSLDNALPITRNRSLQSDAYIRSARFL